MQNLTLEWQKFAPKLDQPFSDFYTNNQIVYKNTKANYKKRIE